MSAILDIITGSPISSALGAVAGILQDYLGTKQENEQKRLEWKHIERMHELQSDREDQRMKLGLVVHQAQQLTDQLNASYEHDANVGETSQWVNNILRLVRPGLTTLCLLGCFWKPETFLAPFNMSFSWWFANRTSIAVRQIIRR
jgi:hypothetical protein